MKGVTEADESYYDRLPLGEAAKSAESRDDIVSSLEWRNCSPQSDLTITVTELKTDIVTCCNPPASFWP